MKTLITFLFFFGIIFSGYAQNNRPANPPIITIKAPLGKKVIIDDAEILFKKVITDSRCPEDVSCIWEGEIHFVVQVTTAATTKTTREFVLNKSMRYGSTKSKTIVTTADYELEVMDVTPVPSSTDNKDTLVYTLLINKIDTHEEE